MAEALQYPFRLSHAFFTSVRFRRKSEMPEPLQVTAPIEVKVHDENFPQRIQINLKIETTEDQPLSLTVELVGLFDLVEGQPTPDRAIVYDFVNERALFMMWPYVTQMVRQVTAQMGIPPLTFPTPIDFNVLAPKSELSSGEGKRG